MTREEIKEIIREVIREELALVSETYRSPGTYSNEDASVSFTLNLKLGEDIISTESLDV